MRSVWVIKGHIMSVEEEYTRRYGNWATVKICVSNPQGNFVVYTKHGGEIAAAAARRIGQTAFFCGEIRGRKHEDSGRPHFCGRPYVRFDDGRVLHESGSWKSLTPDTAGELAELVDILGAPGFDNDPTPEDEPDFYQDFDEHRA